MLQVQLNEITVLMMLDTGATYMCVAKDYAYYFPKSGKYAKTVGFS